MDEKAKKIRGFLKPHNIPVERKKRKPMEGSWSAYAEDLRSVIENLPSLLPRKALT